MPIAPTRFWTKCAEEPTWHYHDERLGTLVLAMTNVNLWKRMNVTARQVAGDKR